MGARDVLPPAIIKNLANDPAFRVLSMNGTHWIDPYTGLLIPAPFGHEEVAKAHLLAHRPWEKMKPKPYGELLVLRWLSFLRENLVDTPIFHHFANGMWLNPYNGRWCHGVRLVGGKITGETVLDMARILAACPEAQAGRFLPSGNIDLLVAQGPTLDDLGGTPAGGQPALPRKHSTTDFLQLKRQFVKMLRRPPQIPGVQLVLHYEPHAPICQDFFDFITLDQDHLLLAMGTCNGKGPGAALMAGLALDALRSTAKAVEDPAQLAARINDRLRLDQAHGSSVALFLALLDLGSLQLTFLSCGHHPAILLHPGGSTTMEHLSTLGDALGSTSGAAFRVGLHPATVPLAAHDVLVIYSDGLWRRRTGTDQIAGRMGVAVTCAQHARRLLPEMVAKVIEETRATDGAVPLTEDLTVLALRVKPA